jgi:hypothetical protein
MVRRKERETALFFMSNNSVPNDRGRRESPAKFFYQNEKKVLRFAVTCDIIPIDGRKQKKARTHGGPALF